MNGYEKNEGVGNDLLVSLDEGVLEITINRPDAMNSLSSFVRDQIGTWMEEASGDLAVRAVLLTGAGEKAFCTGADLRSGKAAAKPRPEGAPDNAVGDGARVIRRGWQRLVGSILDCEKPVIGAVNGTAAGGGMHLALACDIVIAAEESKFIEVFIRRGIAPDAGGAWLLTRLIGIQKAKELFFFGDDVRANDALAMGLVNKVVPRAELMTVAREWANRLASGPTKAIGIAKWLANRALDVDRQTAFQDEAMAQELVTHTEDSKEGIMSFVERRDSAFKGW